MAWLILAAVLLQEKSPLQEMTKVAAHLDTSIEQFIAGKSAEESFKPWKVHESVPAAEAKVREELKKEGATAARTFGVELRMYLYRDGVPVYRLGTYVFMNDKEASLWRLEGTPWKIDGGIPLDKLKESAAPVAEAARSILKHVQEAKPLPFVDLEKMMERTPPRFRVADLAKAKERVRAEAEAVAAAVRELKPTEIRVGLDEQYFTLYGADGTIKDSFLRGKPTISEDGEPVFKFRATPVERQ